MAQKAKSINSSKGRSGGQGSGRNPSVPVAPLRGCFPFAKPGVKIPMLPGSSGPAVEAFTPEGETVLYGSLAEYAILNPKGMAETIQYDQFLTRVLEGNAEAAGMGVDYDKAVGLVAAYGHWFHTFKSDGGSKISVKSMLALFGAIAKECKADAEAMRAVYFEMSRPFEKSDMMPRWKKYRRFWLRYNYSVAFQEAVDKWGAYVLDDEGNDPMRKAKFFWAWWALFDWDDSYKHYVLDGKVSMEALIPLSMVYRNVKDIRAFKAWGGVIERLKKLNGADILASQMLAFWDFLSPSLREEIITMLALEKDDMSEYDLVRLTDLRRRMFVSNSKTMATPYDYCTKSGIAELDAAKFIKSARRLLGKKSLADWNEHMILATYSWLENHPEFVFGKGKRKQTLNEWLIELGYVAEDVVAEDVVAEDVVAEELPAEELIVEEPPAEEPVSVKKPSAEESVSVEDPVSDEIAWALRVTTDFSMFDLPMPPGYLELMKLALKKANKFFGDDAAIRNELRADYAWVLLFRKIHEQLKMLRKYNSQPEFKELQKLIRNNKDLLL